MRMLFGLVLGLVLCSCQGANPGAGDGGGDGPGGNLDARLVSNDAGGDGGDVVMCTGMPRSFPTFNKACTGAGDCAIVLHQTDCCGSLAALGINQGERARFDRDEALCRSMYPGCDCAARPTLAEDGNQALSPTDISVDCRVGACTTFVRPHGVVGDACKVDTDCASKQCLTESQDTHFVGGYCTFKGCDEMSHLCPAGSECSGLTQAGTRICLTKCGAMNTCRSPYRCCGPGPTARWCAPEQSSACMLR